MKNASIAILLLLMLSNRSWAQDWPALRGASGTGQVTTTDGVLKTDSDVILKTRWKKKIGSGYSSVVVSGQNVVTMFADGNVDRVICLDANDGSTRWSFKTGPMFKGENGSFDGPVSTPVIANGRVYALSPTGTLFCLSLDKGEQVWTRNFVQQDLARQPGYGFATSPIFVANTIVVQVGAKDKSLMGLDPKTGQQRWALGTDQIDSQSPAIYNAGGRSIVLAAGGRDLIGVDPANGQQLFTHKHSGGNGKAMVPVAIGKQSVLLTLDDSFSTAVRLQGNFTGTDSVTISDAWQQRSIKNTYNIPVYTDQGVFAFSTRILTCVDPSTGIARWKTRMPGDGFLIVVDGHLIIGTKKGTLHLAKASRESYQELHQLDLFKDLVWSVPAYSDNAVFVRSLGEIARVDLVSKSTSTDIASGNSESGIKVGRKFEEFLESTEGIQDSEKQIQQIDAWIQKQKSFPYIEDGIAHFIYRGTEQDVALAGDFLGARQEQPMIKISGTDFHYFPLKLPSNQRVNYCFLTGFAPKTDVLNPRKTKSTMYKGEMEFAIRLPKDKPLTLSWMAMPDWRQKEYLIHKPNEPLVKPTGVTLDVGPNRSEVKFGVLLPPEYDLDKNRRYPVAYLLDGSIAEEHGDISISTYRLFTPGLNGGVKPSIIVLVNGFGPGFEKTLTEQIVPYVDRTYRTRASRKSRLVSGNGFSGSAALLMAANQNEVFGNVAVESPLVFADAKKAILAQYANVKLPTNVLFHWGRYDMFNPHENWDIRDSSAEIFKKLYGNTQLTLRGGVVNDSTDWSSWRNRYDSVFRLFHQ